MTQCMAENVEDEPAVDDFYCVFLERRVEFGDQRLNFWTGYGGKNRFPELSIETKEFMTNIYPRPYC
jgi:hypothetical protein